MGRGGVREGVGGGRGCIYGRVGVWNMFQEGVSGGADYDYFVDFAYGSVL